MESYVTQKLPQAIARQFAARSGAAGIFGHSMGGCGAIALALRRSVSAFAPTCAPTQGPWGPKAFQRYLGDEGERWAEHDAACLIERGATVPHLLADHGLADPPNASRATVDGLTRQRTSGWYRLRQD